MSNTRITIGMASFELIDLYHDDWLEYDTVVMTICQLVGRDPVSLLSNEQLQHREEIRARVPARQPLAVSSALTGQESAPNQPATPEGGA